MSANTRWVVVATLIALTLAAILFLRPQAAPRAPEMHAATPPPEIVVEHPSPAPSESPPVAAVAPPITRGAPADPPFLVERISGAQDGTIHYRVVDPRTGLMRISGQVYDQRGKPIARARVHARDHPSVAGTSLKGEYFFGDLRPGTYELIATHEDYSDSSPLTADAGSSGVNFMLPPLAAIEGRVVSARDGQPITEFRIRPDRAPVSLILEGEKFKRVRDVEGRFMLDRVYAGTQSVAVGAKGFADTVVNFASIRAGETRQGLEIRLNPGAELRGRVIDSNGKAVRLAQISGGTPRRGAVSDADGSFRLDSLSSGRMELTVKHEDYAWKVAEVSIAGGIVNRTQIVLTEGGVLEGEITQGGRGVPGDVNLHVSDTKLYARAGDDGRYRMTGVPDGTLSVAATIEPSGVCKETWTKSETITVAGGAAPRVDFNFPPNTAVVQGTIYAAPRTPFRGEVQIIASYADFTADGATFAKIHSTSTPDGKYSLCLPAGTIHLNLFISSNRGYEGPNRRFLGLNLRDGEQLRQDIVLYGAKLRVSLAGGAAPDRSTAMAIRGEVAVGEITEAFMKSVSIAGQEAIDQGGSATLFALEPGIYTVLVLAQPSAEEYRQGTNPICLGSAIVSVAQDQELAVSIPLRDK